jgi:hypothetical protein
LCRLILRPNIFASNVFLPAKDLDVQCQSKRYNGELSAQDFMKASSSPNREPLQPLEGTAKKLNGWQKLPADRINPKEMIKAAYPVEEEEGQG